MDREQLMRAVRALYLANDAVGFESLARRTPLTDLAEALDVMPVHECVSVLGMLAPNPRAQLFSHIDPEHQDAILVAMPRGDVVTLFEALPSDDRADIYGRLNDEQRAQIMPALAKIERDDILKLSSYAEGTVGSVTTSDYIAVREDLSAEQALEVVRKEAPEKETIYQLYIVAEDRQLKGTLSLRELVLAPANARVAELMRTEVVFARAEWAREEAAKLISRYDLLAIPVVNGGDKLIGIVTVDDAMDVAEEESTEDFHKGGGTLSLRDLSIKDASLWMLYRKRAVWLVVLVFGNLFSGAGIAYFEDTIAAYIALVFFLPLLIDSGGNAGAQAATLMVRALATGDVVLKDWVRMLGREFGVAALLGLTMALAVSGIGLFRGGPEIALVVATAMTLIVVVGSVIGMSLPFLLSRFHFDPATASAPLVTSIADASGVMIYLSIAVMILGGAPG